MYDFIKGKIEELTPTTVVIDCGHIGYLINISLQSYSLLENLEETKIFVHQYQVRDELPILFGFITKEERDLFRMLISVSGVGGNSARTILSTYSTADLVEIISSGNSKMLKCVKGLGTKTSEKVIVELRDKVLSINTTTRNDGGIKEFSSASNELIDEAISALSMLGYSKVSSTKVVKNILASNPSANIEDIIRLSLKSL